MEDRLWRSDLTLRLARWSLYCVIAVVLMFGATLAYTQLVLEPIEARTETLTGNALPSVRQLTVARDALGRMHGAFEANVPQRTDVENARRDLDTALAAYLLLPQFPEERTLSIKAENAVAVLEEHIDEALAAPMANRESLVPLFQNANAALFRVELFNLDLGVNEVSEIVALKARSRAVSLALSGASLFGAVLATWLVFRVARRQAQWAVEREILLVTRATELEAFAGRIAHDLKGPLGTLTLRLALMKQRDEVAAEKQQEHIDKAVWQVERIDHLIEGLLAFARAGANPPPGARAQLRDVMDEVVEEVRPKAQEVATELRVDPFPPREVACTPGALSSVLSNLLGNAIRYVVESRKPVRQIVVHVDDREQSVRVEVADTGPGLPADAERHVFLPVVRAQTSQPGVGLGLATVKRIVEGFGGRVGVRSVRGEGSVFWFELPKAEGAA